MARTKEYAIWHGMIQRCHNPNGRSYLHYGGRGIMVYKPWRGRGGFKLWMESVGPRPSGKHSLDRINNNGNYEPENVRWATWTEQIGNRRMKLLKDFSDQEISDEYHRRTATR
jgi:hypothetical protein